MCSLEWKVKPKPITEVTPQPTETTDGENMDGQTN